MDLHRLCLQYELVFSLSTVKPVLSDHLQQDIVLAFQTGGCLLLHEGSAESSSMSFMHYFHSAISNIPSVNIDFHVT